MRAGDVMSPQIVAVEPDATVLQAARVMLQHRISGVPVIDKGKLVGIVTEGDFLRRAETGTEKHRPRWLEFLIGPGRLANEYVRACGRKVDEIMSRDLVTVTEDTPLADIVRLMEKHRIKRLPVLRGPDLVGIVSRANLMHALASLAVNAPPASSDDKAIRARLIDELSRQAWAPLNMLNIVVRDGVVELWGTITEDQTREALKVAAENVPGVKAVRDHLTWLEPMTGLVIEAPGDVARTG